MASYRRLISYIYAYPYGKKGQNVGYARVEARDGRLRMQIHLTGLGCGEGRDVYAFVCEGGRNLGIFLGELSNGACPSQKLETEEKNVAGSGRSLSELSGLWIKGEHGENYISSWEDTPVQSMELSVQMDALTEEETREAENDASREREQENSRSFPADREYHLNGVRAQEAGAWTRTPAAGEDDDDAGTPPERSFAQNVNNDPVCVEITPRELPGLLGRAPDPQIRNFLLRSYYRYHRLVLGSCSDGSRFLGAPGMDEPDERAEALALGFPLFLRTEEENRPELFGLWCRPLP